MYELEVVVERFIPDLLPAPSIYHGTIVGDKWDTWCPNSKAVILQSHSKWKWN